MTGASRRDDDQPPPEPFALGQGVLRVDPGRDHRFGHDGLLSMSGRERRSHGYARGAGMCYVLRASLDRLVWEPDPAVLQAGSFFRGAGVGLPGSTIAGERATYAETMSVSGHRRYPAASLARDLWRANAAAVRDVYGDRAEQLYPDMLRLEDLFAFDPTPREALQILKDLRTYLTNTALHPDWASSPPGRVCWRIGRRAQFEYDLALIAESRAPTGRPAIRWMRRASWRLMNPRTAAPTRSDDGRSDLFEVKRA